MPKICGSTYPVSRNMLEYYLSQQGFTPISIETSDEDKKGNRKNSLSKL